MEWSLSSRLATWGVRETSHSLHLGSSGPGPGALHLGSSGPVPGAPCVGGVAERSRHAGVLLGLDLGGWRWDQGLRRSESHLRVFTKHISFPAHIYRQLNDILGQ